MSKPKAEKPVRVPDLNALRLERDQGIALEFVRREQGSHVRAELAAELGLNLRLIYRAIDAHLDWAKADVKRQAEASLFPDEIGGGSPNKDSHPDRGAEAPADCTPRHSRRDSRPRPIAP